MWKGGGEGIAESDVQGAACPTTEGCKNWIWMDKRAQRMQGFGVPGAGAGQGLITSSHSSFCLLNRSARSATLTEAPGDSCGASPAAGAAGAGPPSSPP